MRYITTWPRKSLTTDFLRSFEDIFEGLNEGLPKDLQNFSPALDVHEEADKYVLLFDLPGLKQEEINVEVKDNTLYVSGERKREEKKEGDVVRFERVYGRFERSMTLPRNVNADKIDATYEDGVLTLSVPKIATANTRTIQVKKN